MSHANPTPIRVGMTGTFAGKPYTIIARVVMGMEEEGATYYWNEFYLSDGSDRIAMLVCEEVYGAQQWRLFSELAPTKPLTAREAGLKQVGDRVDFDGVSAEITVVDETRVHFIEGKAPDWVSVGDVAQYFNAEAGGKMWVVSWSGDVVEYFRGMNLHGELVARALNLPPAALTKTATSTQWLTSGRLSQLGAFLALGFLALPFLPSMRGCGSSRSIGFSAPGQASVATPAPPVVERRPIPPQLFAVGTNVVMGGRKYQVISHRVTAFTRVNSQWHQHHYQVTDEQGQTNLLSVDPIAIAPILQLYKPFTPSRPPTPQVAGSMRGGDKVTLDGYTGTIAALEMSQEVARTGPPISGLATNGLTYHYIAGGSNGPLLASWNAERVVFYRLASMVQWKRDAAK